MPSHCPDCGPAPVNHAREKISVTLDWTTTTLLRPFETLARRAIGIIAPLRLERCIPYAFRTAAALGLGAVADYPGTNSSSRTRCLWESAIARGIACTEFRLRGKEEGLSTARFKNDFVVFDGLPRPRGAESASLTWMDNKGLMKKKFRAAGIPVPRGATCLTESGARKTFRSLNKPVVTKPVIGSRSRHTNTRIATEEALIRGFKVAKQISPGVVVEEELEGSVFRATVIGGKLVGVVRRDPPRVAGDGRHSVRELVSIENEHPLRRGPLFHEIPADARSRDTLIRQGFSWDDVPPAGAVIYFSEKTSRGIGGTTTELTDETHPENARLFERIAKVLDDPLVGIDFITNDIRAPWTAEPRAGVIECNSLPFIDLHHYPFAGTPRDAAGALWEIVFPALRGKTHSGAQKNPVPETVG